LFFSGFCWICKPWCVTITGWFFLGIFAAIGIGVTMAVSWGVFGQLAPKESLNRFAGLLLAAIGLTKPFGRIFPATMGPYIFFFLAAFLAFFLPTEEQHQGLRQPLAGQNAESYT
jgi:MFS family permease